MTRPATVLGLLLALVAAGFGPRAGSLPAIVLVSRAPLAGGGGAVPGLGPHHRAAAAGGRLLLRERDGTLRELAPPGAFFDVADPSVSLDATRVAFAGLSHADSAWRLYEIGLDGRGLRPLTRVVPGARHDDLDPCWIGAYALCFSSTRDAPRSEYADVPATNLWVLDARDADGVPRRITAERNGADEPALDPRTGRVAFARWWFNRRRPSLGDPAGWTLDPGRAVPGDSVNLWQAIEITPDGGDPRLAAGEPGGRRTASAYQPAPLPSGGLAAVVGLNLGLSPGPAATAVQLFSPRLGRPRHVLGAIVPDRGGDPYAAARGLAPPSACAPAALPDGRLLLSYAPGGRGDFGLYVVATDGSEPRQVIDLPGTLELDAAPVVRRPLTPALEAAAARAVAVPGLIGPSLPIDRGALARNGTFRFLCLNVFAGGPMDGGGGNPPRPASGARVRFFAPLAAPGARGGDTLILVREAAVAADGSIDQRGLPAGVPMFEQVVDAAGRVLLSAHGAAHVAGFNAGVPGGTSRCIGCHAGHSTLLRQSEPAVPAWFNAAPAARVRVTSLAPGHRAEALIDRRTRGDPVEVAWVSADSGAAGAIFEWPVPIRLRELVLHGVATPGTRAGPCEVRLERAGREVGRLSARSVGRGATRMSPDAPIVVDAIEIRLTAPGGRAAGARSGLAEVEVLARLEGSAVP